MEYSPSEAAKLAGVNKSTVLRAVRSGRLSASRHTDGSFTIDGSELARVYDLHHLPEAMPRGASPAPPATRGASGGEAAVLRARLEAAEVQAARDREERERERETAEAQLARERETVDDLRKRLDRAEERVLALTAQPTPAAPQPAPELLAVVDELRQRLEASEARNQALVGGSPPTPEADEEPLAMVVELHKRREQAQALVEALEAPSTPQEPQERPIEAPVPVRTANLVRGFLGRLLGRGSAS